MKKAFIIIALCVCALQLSAQTPSDSVGVYTVNADGINPMELINYKNTKISRGFMSAKAKLEFDGATSPNHFKGTAKFRIYFGQPSPNDMVRLYMFMPNYSIKDFGVGQFEVKKKNRLLTTANMSVFSGGNAGAKQTENLSYEVIEVHPGVYDVIVTGKPGEYCIMHTFRGSAGYGGVFDFTIE